MGRSCSTIWNFRDYVMSKIFFTSDLHFSHQNILKFCPNTRKYDSVEEMNRGLIARWQEQVTEEDTVYILGDVFFTKLDEALSITQQLPGHKHLILGNHDKVIRNNSELIACFESVSEYKTITIDKIHVVLFHFPILNWDRLNYGSFHFHGHSHGQTPQLGRVMDVGVDTHPLNGLWEWDELKRKMLTIEINKIHH